jgi:hypothetical protein
MPPGRRRYTKRPSSLLEAGGRNNAIRAEIFDHLPIVLEALALVAPASRRLSGGRPARRRRQDVSGTAALHKDTLFTYWRLAGGIMLFMRRYSTICP